MQVTAIIPMYNAAATIERCLASITAQTTPPARIIVVDDCSTDDSPQIVRQLGIANLDLVRTPANGGGAGAARNFGIARVTTEFVAFLDADDTWMLEFLERVCAGIQHYRADYGSAGGVRLNRGRPLRNRSVGAGGGAVLDLTDDFWRVAQRFMPIHTSATVARTALVTRAGGFPEDVRIGEDMLLFIGLWLHGRFVFVDEPLFESVAPETGLTGGRLSYRDVKIGLVRAARALGRAVRMRRRGTGWFAIWFARRVVNRHVLWFRRKVRRPSRT